MSIAIFIDITNNDGNQVTHTLIHTQTYTYPPTRLCAHKSALIHEETKCKGRIYKRTNAAQKATANGRLEQRI